MEKDDHIGRRAAAGLVAILITVALYFMKVPPFSLLTAQGETTEAAEAAPQAANAPAPAAENPMTGAQQFLIVVPNPFDHVIEADPATHIMKDGADTWTKTVTLINPSEQPVAVYFFAQGLEPCPDTNPQNCVQFPASITVGKGGSQTVNITFTKVEVGDSKPVEGKMILAGGNVQREFPFSITGEWQKTAFDYTQLGAWILAILLGAVVLYIIYLVLYSKVFLWLQPERSLPLRMDVTGDNKALWATFASRLTEMQEQGYCQNLINPRAKDEGKLDLPTNLGKEGDIVRAVIDLLSWILPRRGVSILLQSMENQIKGKGLSVTLVKNNNDQILAEHLFWAGDYGLDAQSGDIEYLLMTAVILWLSDWLKERYAPKAVAKESDWEVRTYCELASMVWSRDRALGRRLYMDVLFRDPANKQAQSGLGRIWIEESQRNDNSKHEKLDCLNFAVSYLNEVCKNGPASNDFLWFAAKYNLAVARLYQGCPNDAEAACSELFTEIDNHSSQASNEQESPEFILWMSKFRSMASIFRHSVTLENERPATQPELDKKIGETIKDLKSALVEKGNTLADPGRDLPPGEWLLVTLDYRSQYNAACYFSRCHQLARKFHNKTRYAETALDYLRLALGHGGGLASYAWDDQALKPLRDEFKEEFEDIAPKKATVEEEKKNGKAVLRLVIDKPIEIKSE